MTRQMPGDAEWAALKETLQAIERIRKYGGKGRSPRFLTGACYLLRTGLAWADLLVEFGNSDAMRKRVRRWCKTGTWQPLFEGTIPVERIEKLLLGGTIGKAAYRWRHGIENGFSRMRDLIRIILHRDRTSLSCLGFLHLACAILNIRRDNFLARES